MDPRGGLRPSASTNSASFVAAHVAEARFFLLKMFGAEHPSPIVAYLVGARGIDDVKELPPLAEIQHAWTEATRALCDWLDTMPTAELDAPLTCPFPLPISNPDVVESLDVLRPA